MLEFPFEINTRELYPAFLRNIPPQLLILSCSSLSFANFCLNFGKPLNGKGKGTSLEQDETGQQLTFLCAGLRLW